MYLPGPLRIAIQVALLMLVGVILLHTVLQVNLIALVAVPTVLTAVIGFALKDTITRLFDGIMLGRVMHIGDWVNLVGKEGVITDISLIYVTLKTREGDWLLVPNNLVAQKEIVNYSHPTRLHRCSVAVEASYKDSPTRVIEVLERTAASVPGVVTSPNPDALVVAYRDSGIQYHARFWIDDFAERFQIESLVLAYIWQAFRRDGIEIPYPVRMIQHPVQGGQDAEQVRAAVRERLTKIDFLAGLSPAEFDRLAAGVERRVFLSGEVVVREGEPGEELFYIDRGHATISARTNTGSQMVLTLSAGQYFGEMSLLTGEPRAATVTAETELHVLVIGKRIMQELIATNPMLAEHMGDTLAERQAALALARQTTPEPALTAANKRQRSLVDRIRRFLGRV
jgi:CRP-like cAMP-binding protein